MSGAQLVVFPILLLMLPTVAAFAWWLKRRYAKAIVRLQQETSSPAGAQHAHAATMPAETGLASQAVPRISLTITPADEFSRGSSEVDEALRLRRRVLQVHFASGLLYWCALLLLVASVLAGANAPGTLLLVGPSLLLFLLVPAGVAWALHAGMRREVMTIGGALIIASGSGLLLFEAGWESELGFSLGYASLAVMVSAFMRPSIRGAGLPLVIAGIVGWLVLSALAALALALDDSPDDAVASAAENVAGALLLVSMLVAAIGCGWRTLMMLSTRYAARRFSDMQLALAAYWALLTAFMLGSVLKEPLLFLFTRLTPEWVCVIIALLWLLWRWLQSLALKRAVRNPAPPIGTLLFLRVFKASGRSEAFTERFFAYWRFAGPVWMIAGPDLAGAYLEPDEFFAWLRGRLRERFVADPREAVPRLEALDMDRDPDGRFRINELLCTNETWQPTVVQMIARADVILLDLREYSEQRRGTRFELTELLRRARLEKVLLLIDARDDIARFTAEIQSVWSDIGGDRSNRLDTGSLQVLRFSKGSHAEVHGLLRAAAHAAHA